VATLVASACEQIRFTCCRCGTPVNTIKSLRLLKDCQTLRSLSDLSTLSDLSKFNISDLSKFNISDLSNLSDLVLAPYRS